MVSIRCSTRVHPSGRAVGIVMPFSRNALARWFVGSCVRVLICTHTSESNRSVVCLVLIRNISRELNRCRSVCMRLVDVRVRVERASTSTSTTTTTREQTNQNAHHRIRVEAVLSGLLSSHHTESTYVHICDLVHYCTQLLRMSAMFLFPIGNYNYNNSIEFS